VLVFDIAGYLLFFCRAFCHCVEGPALSSHLLASTRIGHCRGRPMSRVGVERVERDVADELAGLDLSGISGSAAQSGEGLWTVDAAKELGIPAPVIADALEFRIQSQKNPSYTGKIISALRNQFGGHEAGEKPEGQKVGR
jgi:6-phosphogluconate dehydrogenase